MTDDKTGGAITVLDLMEYLATLPPGMPVFTGGTERGYEPIAAPEVLSIKRVHHGVEDAWNDADAEYPSGGVTYTGDTSAFKAVVFDRT